VGEIHPYLWVSRIANKTALSREGKPETDSLEGLGGKTFEGTLRTVACLMGGVTTWGKVEAF